MCRDQRTPSSTSVDIRDVVLAKSKPEAATEAHMDSRRPREAYGVEAGRLTALNRNPLNDIDGKARLAFGDR